MPSSFLFELKGISLRISNLRFNNIVFVCYEIDMLCFIAVLFGFPGDYVKYKNIIYFLSDKPFTVNWKFLITISHDFEFIFNFLYKTTH